MALITVFILLVLAHSLFSGRLQRTVFTAPILFTSAGMVAVALMPELRERQASTEDFLRLAELGLTLLLFTEASRTSLKVLKRFRNLPTRLLSTGMLLTLLLGTLGALIVFGDLSVWEAGILAAILAPTDAGLGRVIVDSPRVPIKIRQALNMEAGLNDGLSVPFMLFFIALAVPGEWGDSPKLTNFILEQLGYGAFIGMAIGLVGGLVLAWVHQKKWMLESSQQLGVLALPLLCVIASRAADASMFIAAFVAGLAVQVRFREAGRQSAEFTEQWGNLLNLSVFFLFGLIVVRNWQGFTWSHVLYAVISLTVVRMLPVTIALIGTRMSRATVLFMGWFGPRGLASIVLGLVYLEHVSQHAVEPTIRLAVIMTVLLSIFAHGLSALPGINLYAESISKLGAEAPEFEIVEEMVTPGTPGSAGGPENSRDRI